MGEHKLNRNDITDQIAAELTRRATDQGKLIEIGWIAMQSHVISKEASKVQVEEMRKAFFMGAEHLYASIMNVMSDDHEPTEQDMRRMQLIHDELEAFRKEATSHHTAPGRKQ